MKSYPRTHLGAALLLACTLVIVITALPAKEGPAQRALPVSLDLRLPEPDQSAEIEPTDVKAEIERRAEPATLSANTSKWLEVTVKPGDNLALIFKRHDLSARDLHHILALGKTVAVLKKILPGQTLAFQIGATGKLQSIKFEQNAFDTLVVQRQENGFQAAWQSATPETIIAYTNARITKDKPSLYHAGKAAGLSDNVIMKLANIFQWDISFALDLREGDHFTLMYEQIFVDGEMVKEGDVIAAAFQNMGKKHEAIRYTDLTGRDDYYTPDGLSLRKAFIRDPVHFSHVSSSFNLRRLHPIHKRVMPHRGIDYAARKGTPVIASGDGKISIRRQNEASGKYVVIQHGEQYTTKYLHLSAFARNIKPGKKVKQGQVIGYVGATGWATAPHLHYEFLVNGVHRNPRTVQLPKALPIPNDELHRFKNSIAPVLAQLESLTGRALANSSQLNDPSEG